MEDAMKYKTTEDFAAAKLVKPASVRSRYCRMGSYFGARPHKLANGRLAWPDDEAQQRPEQTGSAE